MINLKQKLKLYFIVLLSTLILLSSCNKVEEKDISVEPEENSKKIEANYGGEISLPLTNLKTINPLINENLSYYYFSSLVYEGLFELDENFQAVPILVENYNISDNGRRIDIKLKENIKWHDGKDLTAEDVIFTLEAIKTAGKHSFYGKYLSQAIDYYGDDINSSIKMNGSNKDLKVYFSKPFSNNVESLCFPILPKHKFTSVKDALRNENFPLIGTGPFKFKSYRALKELELSRNEDYHLGKPYLEKVIGKIYSDKEESMLAFESGQVNTTLTRGVDWERYGKNSRFKVIEFPSEDYEFIGFNFTNPILSGEDGLEIRKAISLAINKKDIVDKVYLGHASIVNTPVHINSWLSSKKGLSYDLDKANEYLDGTKFNKYNDVGYRVDDVGNKLSLNLLTNTSNPIRLSVADYIKNNLSDIGIEVVIIPEIDTGQILTLEQKQNQWIQVERDIRSGNYDLFLGGWELNQLSTLPFLLDSSSRYGGNLTRYRDEEMDKLIYQSFYSGASRDDKKEAYDKVETKFLEELPHISLFYKNKALIIDNRFYGDLKPSFFKPYRGLEKVFIHEEETSKNKKN